MICSEFKVTLDPLGASPVVILAYDDEIEEELSVNTLRSAELVPFVRGSYIQGIGRGNKATQIKFTRRVEHSVVIDAREALFEHGIEALANAFSVLISIQGGKEFLLFDAVANELPSTLSNATETTEEWEIIGGEIIDLGLGGIAALAVLDSSSADVLDSDNEVIYGSSL